MKPLIVTGSDTGVGKTVVCAMLTMALEGVYWKPIQSGTAGARCSFALRISGSNRSNVRRKSKGEAAAHACGEHEVG